MENLLLLQVSELLLQSGHLIQTLHPPPLAVLVIHLCSTQQQTYFPNSARSSPIKPTAETLIDMTAPLKARLSPELSPSSDTDELTVSSSSVLLPSCSGKSTSISSWLLSFFSREWTGMSAVGKAGGRGVPRAELFVFFPQKRKGGRAKTASRLANPHLPADTQA